MVDSCTKNAQSTTESSNSLPNTAELDSTKSPAVTEHNAEQISVEGDVNTPSGSSDMTSTPATSTPSQG